MRQADRHIHRQIDGKARRLIVSLARRQAGRQAGRWLRKNDGHLDQETKVSFRGNN